MYEQDAVYFVTARTIQARMLLRPSADLNEVAGGVLARAVQRYGVELYGFVFASNHVHMLVRARDGRLSGFMQYFLGNLARKVARLVDWRGTFWERRFSAEPVLDDAAMEGRLRYILAHGVKEGLVRRVAEWPGLSCLNQLFGEAKRVFRWFQWEKRWERGQLKDGGNELFSERWAEPVVLELHTLPHWRHFDEPTRRSALETMVASIEEEWLAVHPSPLGPTRVQAKDPHEKSASAKRAPRPLCHSAIATLRKAFLESYRSFIAAYRVASERFRNGEFSVSFPPFAFRPPGFAVRAIDAHERIPQGV